jgi:hypothetical protein
MTALPEPSSGQMTLALRELWELSPEAGQESQVIP